MRSLMPRREEGAVAVIVALMLIVFVAAVAVAVDVGGLMLHRRGLVNSSDAAALSAARTCARGGFDDHGTTEDAADTAALANSLITDAEARGILNIIPSLSTTCGATGGHVTVGYTSQQSLFFAPVIGFNNESPVHTEATASWGLGSNNPVPLVLSSQLVSSCPKPPPTGTNTVGQAPCGTWYDNDTLNTGNFGFLSLNSEGWNVPADDNCSGGTAGSSDIGDWVSGAQPASVSLNWTEPTYVCNIGGFKGQSHPWDELETLARDQAIRDFPITWEGPSSPGFGAPAQGSLPAGGKIEKFDVIGFAALRIMSVLKWGDAGPTITTTQQPFTDFTYTNAGITFGSTLPVGAAVDYTWSKVKNGNTVSDRCQFVTTTAFSGTVLWKDFGKTGQCPGNNDVVTGITNIAITVPVTTTTDGPCGPRPSDNSAKCVITQWLGSTVTGDYPTDQLDNVTVVRLCDLNEGTCLDQ
jgi:hypothetical protein